MAGALFDFEIGIETKKAEEDIKKASKKIGDVVKNTDTEIEIDVDTETAEKQIDDLVDSINDDVQRINGIVIPAPNIDVLKNEFDDLQKSANNSINAQKKALAQLATSGKNGTAEYNKLQKELKENVVEAKKLEKAIDDIDDSLEDDKSIGINFPTDLGGGLAGIKDQILQINPLFGVLAVGVGAAVAGLVQLNELGAEVNASLALVSAQTGLTGSALEELGEQGKKVFQKGLGESLNESIELVGKAQQLYGDLFDTEEIGNFTAGLNGIAKVLKTDVNDVLLRSKTFVQNFGLSSQEALDLLAYGAQNGITSQEDLLDTLSEYSPLMKKSGLSAAEFMDFLVKGAENGLDRTDKLGDALKEIGIRTSAGDFKTAFKGLSAGATDAEKQILKTVEGIADLGKSGEIDLTEMLSQINAQLTEGIETGNLSDNLRDQILIGVGGTPVEDIGAEMFQTLLGAFDGDTSEITKAGQEASKAFTESVKPKGTEGLKRLFVAQFAGIAQSINKVFNGIAENISNFLIPVFEIVGEAFSNLGTHISEGTGFVGILTDTFKTLYDIVKLFVEVILKTLIQSFKVVWEVVKIVYAVLESVTSIIFTVVNTILKLIIATAKWISSFEFIQGIIKGVSAVIGVFGDIIQLVVDKIVGFFNTITDGLATFEKYLDKFLGLNEEIKKNTEKTKENTVVTQENAVSNEENSEAIVVNTAATTENTKAKKTNLEVATQLYLANKQNAEQFNNVIEKLKEETLQAQLLKEAQDAIKSIVNAQLVFEALVTIETTDIPTNDIDKIFENLRAEFDEPLEMPEVIGLDEFEASIEAANQLILDSAIENATSFETLRDLSVSAFESISDGFKLLGKDLVEGNKTIGESFADFGKNIISASLDFLDQMVNIASAQIITQALASPESIATFGVAGLAKSAIIIALLKTGIGAAKAGVGAEDGGLITENYNKRAGATDTIPMLVAPNEFIMRASATKNNIGLLDHINNGGSLDSYLSNSYISKDGILNKSIVDTTNTSIQTQKIVVQNQQNSVSSDYRELLSEVKMLRKENHSKTINVNDHRILEITDKRIKVKKQFDVFR